MKSPLFLTVCAVKSDLDRKVFAREKLVIVRASPVGHDQLSVQ
jgi:hypothetical protein